MKYDNKGKLTRGTELTPDLGENGAADWSAARREPMGGAGYVVLRNIPNNLILISFCVRFL